MKRLIVIAIVVFSLGILLLACGGGSKKISVPSSGNQESSTVQKGTSTKIAGNDLKVSGKGCPTTITKVTSKDLGETFLNYFCSDLANGRISGPSDDPNKSYQNATFKSEGALNFDSVKLTSSTGKDADVSYTVSFQNCADCPREFDGSAGFSINQLGEWQLSSGFSITETQASGKAKVLREVKVTSISADVFFGNGDQPQTDINVEGGPLTLYILCQFDDGHVIEISRVQGGNNQTYAWQVNERPKANTKAKIVAYSFLKYRFRTDPIYLNK